MTDKSRYTHDRYECQSRLANVSIDCYTAFDDPDYPTDYTICRHLTFNIHERHYFNERMHVEYDPSRLAMSSTEGVFHWMKTFVGYEAMRRERAFYTLQRRHRESVRQGV